jgi:uncharacterized membrane protein
MTDKPGERLPISRAELAAALLGGALIGYSRERRGGMAAWGAVAGAVLTAAAVARSLSRRVVRAGAARRRVRLRTTLVVELPVREVFAFCHNFENFPRIVRSLECVTDYQDGRARWEVRSPKGSLLVWDTVITKYVPNVVIAWRSVPGSVVDNRGLIRFVPLSAHSTRLDVDLQYDPCHTGFADAVRALVAERRQDRLSTELTRASGRLRAPADRALDQTITADGPQDEEADARTAPSRAADGADVQVADQ